jgi:SAM-dependent methyltransferase
MSGRGARGAEKPQRGLHFSRDGGAASYPGRSRARPCEDGEQMPESPSTLQRRLRAMRRRIGDMAFERRIGVKTSDYLDREELGYSDERLQHYEPSSWRTLQKVLPKRSVSGEDVFIDLGSGMGRIVLRAAEYPFKRVIGVEMSPELHEVAVANLESCRDRWRCGDVELICSDVLAYDFPDDATVVFIYNSFQGEIFDRAMRKVFESYDRSPRRIRIFYRNPTQHERLMETGRVRILEEWKHSLWRGWPRGVILRGYEVVPAGGGAGAPG